jgi:hypothetical protein
LNPYASPAAPDGAYGGTGGGGTGSARLEGDVLVVSKGAALRSVCLKCGKRDGIVRRDAKFQWTPMWARLSVVFCTLGGLIAILVTTKRGNLSVPLCVPCNRRWGQAVTAIVLGAVGLVGSILYLRARASGVLRRLRRLRRPHGGIREAMASALAAADGGGHALHV